MPAAVKVAVLGNHDLWTDHTIIERALARGGATVLVNASLRLPPPHDDVVLVGLDDPWTGTPDADAAFAGTAGDGVRIAVVHAPEGYPFVRDRGAALMLCGHTHGGQVATPRGPIVVPGPLGHAGRRGFTTSTAWRCTSRAGSAPSRFRYGCSRRPTSRRSPSRSAARGRRVNDAVGVHVHVAGWHDGR